MAERIINARTYQAGQTVSRTFNDLGRFGRCGVWFTVGGWPAQGDCLRLTVEYSNSQRLVTTIDGTPPKSGAEKGLEIEPEKIVDGKKVYDPDAFDSVTVTGEFLQAVNTRIRLTAER